MEIITEIYQFLFISSIIYIFYVLFDLSIKMYGRFVLKTDARFKIGVSGKIIFWISLGIIFTYLI
jgi:hypothetical protein